MSSKLFLRVFTAGPDRFGSRHGYLIILNTLSFHAKDITLDTQSVERISGRLVLTTERSPALLNRVYI